MMTILFLPKVQDVTQNMSTCFVKFNVHKSAVGTIRKSSEKNIARHKQETNTSSRVSCCQACNRSHKRHTSQDHLYHRTCSHEYTLANTEHKHNVYDDYRYLFQPEVPVIMQNLSKCIAKFKVHKKLCIKFKEDLTSTLHNISRRYKCEQKTNTSRCSWCCQASNRSHKRHTCQDRLYCRTCSQKHMLPNTEQDNTHDMYTSTTRMTSTLF